VIEDLKDSIQSKKITVICPKYFGYEHKIVEKLIEYGGIVFYIDERPNNSIIGKGLIRLFPFLYKINIIIYYNKKIKDMTKCDIVFVINPESLSKNILLSIKKTTKASKYILYMWDSFSNKKRAKQLIPFFDKVFTFDPDDAKKNNIIFRPLFFLLEKEDTIKYNEKIDISFIGTGHSDRGKIINIIKNQCEKLKINYYFILYLQSIFIFFFYKIIKKTFKGMKSSDFIYTPVKYNDYMNILKSSKIIIDIEHPKQIGLTMRTYEALGKEKKLITTNSNIKEYDFYDDENICIINRNDPIININILEKKYKKIPEHIYYKYSIDGWLEDILIH
jgi:hypothetical protein